jgi:hypothetical protein
VPADLFGEVGIYINEEPWPLDERIFLDQARRLGAAFVISGEVSGALRWRAETER